MAARALLPALVAVAASGPAAAQHAREPLDVPADGRPVPIAGPVPFRLGDDRAWASPALDDRDWSTLEVPGLWHAAGLGAADSVGWYRIHLRLSRPPAEPLALRLPPVATAWELWLSGARIETGGDVSGDGARDARESVQIVSLPPTLLHPGDNVLALRVAGRDGRGGIAGTPRVGSREILLRRDGLRGLFTSGFLLLFTLMALFHLGIWAAGPRERGTLWVGLVACALAVFSVANNEHWYLFFDGADWKLRARVAARLLVQAAAMALVGESLRPRVIRPALALGGLSAALALSALAAPLRWVAELDRLSWLLVAVCIVWVFDVVRAMPLRSAVVRSGLRACLLGMLASLVYEVGAGQWEYPGPGAFEIAFVPLLVSVAVAVSLDATLLRLRAARVVVASRDGMAVLGPGGAVELSNPALHELLGRGEREIARDGVLAALLPDSRGPTEEALRRLRERGPGAAPQTLDVALAAPAGRLTAELVAVALDEQRILLSLRDMTQRQRLEEELARSRRLDSLGMLAGGIAHDFNNLLAGVLASASDLEHEGDREERARRIASIVESARRGGALTQRLLQFARGRVTSTLGVQLESALPDVVDMLGRTLGRNIEWLVDVEAGLPKVALDEAELEQLLLNLCVNARDAMGPRGGTVEIRARAVAGAGEEPMVAVSVRDDGRGIPKEILAHVFEPFVTTKGSGAGTGLGLAVVYGIVKQRGGEIRIESQEGRGTTVTLLLPLNDATPSDSLPPEGVAAEPKEGTRVLLVDDEPALRTFLSRALERRGMRVETLHDGQAVLRWMLDLPAEPFPVEVVVMDVMMPVVDGVEAANSLRAKWPGLPVVISSGYTGRDTISPLEATGPTMLLEKPYQVDDLVRAMGRVCGLSPPAAPPDLRTPPPAAS